MKNVTNQLLQQRALNKDTRRVCGATIAQLDGALVHPVLWRKALLQEMKKAFCHLSADQVVVGGIKPCDVSLPGTPCTLRYMVKNIILPVPPLNYGRQQIARHLVGFFSFFSFLSL